MVMDVTAFLNSQQDSRRELMSELHAIIVANDTTIVPVLEKMMGKEMILYKEGGTMKYGLASVKNHMSFHCLPIYAFAALHEKYAKLLPLANFQKGCINFNNAKEMPPAILAALVSDCSAVSMKAMREQWQKKK
jgi:hypothetical protein